MNRSTPDDVAEILNKFAEAMSRLMVDHHQQQVTAVDLTLQQVQVLRVLRRGPLTPGQLATELGMSASSVSQLTDRLVRKALIERKEGSGDRRSLIIAISAKGKRTVDQFRKYRGLLFREAMDSLSEAEQAHVVGAMKLVITALEHGEQGRSGASHHKTQD